MLLTWDWFIAQYVVCWGHQNNYWVQIGISREHSQMCHPNNNKQKQNIKGILIKRIVSKLKQNEESVVRPLGFNIYIWQLMDFNVTFQIINLSYSFKPKFLSIFLLYQHHYHILTTLTLQFRISFELFLEYILIILVTQFFFLKTQFFSFWSRFTHIVIPL